MISIPKIEKPSDKLTKLTRVEIICSVWHIVFSYQFKAEPRFSGYIRRARVDDRKWNKRPSGCPRDIFLVGNHASDGRSTMSRAEWMNPPMAVGTSIRELLAKLGRAVRFEVRHGPLG